MPSAPVPADVKRSQASLAEVSGLRLTPAPTSDKAKTSPSGSWGEMSEEEGAFGNNPTGAPWAEMSDEDDFVAQPTATVKEAKSARTPLSGKAKPFILAGAAADVDEDAAPAQKGTPPEDFGCGYPKQRRWTKQDAAADAGGAGAPSACTSLIMRNVPYAWTRDKLVELLNSAGFSEAYDFVYVPVDLKSMNSLGYAFVNLADACHVDRFMDKFQNFDDWQCDVCKTKCRVAFSRTQKLSGYIRRFQDSAIMSESLPDECKPAIFKNGVRIPFPEPTKTLRELNSVYKPQFGQRRNKLSMKQ